jgi:hypothetical protein
MHKAAANLGVSSGVGSMLTCEYGCVKAAANLGVSGGVGSKLTCERRRVRRLLTLVCLVV